MLNERPVAEGVFFAASCHNQKELEKAQRLGADFVFLSQVKPVAGDRVQGVLSWADFENLAQTASLPIYALGRVSESDLDEALLRGAVGIAGVSAFTNMSS
jgi:8-oxo-dGTP diphosphatase